MAGKRFKLPKPGEVYLDTVKNAYFRITEVLEADVRFYVKEANSTVYGPSSYELSMSTFKSYVKSGKFIKYTSTVRVLYGK